MISLGWSGCLYTLLNGSYIYDAEAVCLKHKTTPSQGETVERRDINGKLGLSEKPFV